MDEKKITFMIFRCVSIYITYPGTSICRFIRHTFGFPFCQRLWALTKRRDDIVVADMELDMVADMEVDKVYDKVADMVADKEVDKLADMVAGHGCCLIGPKLFRPEP